MPRHLVVTMVKASNPKTRTGISHPGMLPIGCDLHSFCSFEFGGLRNNRCDVMGEMPHDARGFVRRKGNGPNDTSNAFKVCKATTEELSNSTSRDRE